MPIPPDTQAIGSTFFTQKSIELENLINSKDFHKPEEPKTRKTWTVKNSVDPNAKKFEPNPPMIFKIGVLVGYPIKNESTNWSIKLKNIRCV